ncbi:protein-tyrosine phosphatase family protein [Lysinibacillus xylanilyticus]|uniref:protein-tyrosine phosphatase family protein n=1 Tax=Lysinibacillus xylanilyticus TaxID=582475 RepID=UPI00083C9F3B|nr:dual specificity protein phosphatase family protein [Lysinibacillus xylanilyticus]
MEKNYDVLVKDRLFFGGAKDADSAFELEKVDVVIDVRVNGLSTEEQELASYEYKHMPIADEDIEVAPSIQKVAKEIVSAYDNGQKVYFHCGGGGGRAGVAATAVLMELGVANSLEEAEEAVKNARPQVTIRPKMADALHKLYK